MSLAVFIKTDDQIDFDRINIREQIEDIMEDPNKFKFLDYKNDNEMYSIIYNYLDEAKGVTACGIWEDMNNIFIAYFVDVAECTDKKINIIGSQFTSQHVVSNLIIVKNKLSYEINNNNVKTIMRSDTFTRLELLDMFDDLFLKTCIVINTSGEMGSFKYIMNPLEHLMMTDNEYDKHYIYHEYEIYTHVMMIIVDIREINGQLNGMATLLAGKPVNGTVFVALYKKPEYNENPPYVSLSIEVLNTILEIRSKSQIFTTGMIASQQEYVNFQKLLDLEKNKHSNKPSMKATEIKGELLNMGKL